jgi:adenosylmethionine-8-amino-7-oxononanoate aminotransferase
MTTPLGIWHPFTNALLDPAPLHVASAEGVCLHLADGRGMRQAGDTRHIGTIGALELRADDPGYLSALRPKLYDFFLRRGVLLRPLGNVIYVIPPYVITREELHHVYDIITEAIEALL